MSRTLRGTLSVDPFLSSLDFSAGRVFFATLFAFSADFFAAAFALVAVLLALVVAFVAVFFAAAEALLAVFLEAAVAFFAVAFVAFFALSAAFAAAATFFATAALKPASWSFFAPADATLLTESSFAVTSFFAVAAPTPGSAVKASIFEEPFFAAIVSLAPPCKATLFNTSP